MERVIFGGRIYERVGMHVTVIYGNAWLRPEFTERVESDYFRLEIWLNAGQFAIWGMAIASLSSEFECVASTYGAAFELVRAGAYYLSDGQRIVGTLDVRRVELAETPPALRERIDAKVPLRSSPQIPNNTSPPVYVGQMVEATAIAASSETTFCKVGDFVGKLPRVYRGTDEHPVVGEKFRARVVGCFGELIQLSTRDDDLQFPVTSSIDLTGHLLEEGELSNITRLGPGVVGTWATLHRHPTGAAVMIPSDARRCGMLAFDCSGFNYIVSNED